MAKIIQKTPTVVVGAFTENVPFHNTLFIAELDVTDPITLTPVGNLGTPEIYRPIAGSKVIYKLTAASPNVPTISSGFNIDPASVLYDATPGALNIVTMWYDGAEFWLTMANNLATPIPTPTAGVSRVGDFGWGGAVIVPNVIMATTALHDTGAGIAARVSAFDIITSVHYTGTDTLTYTLGTTTGSIPGPVSDTDPKLAYVEFACADLGLQTIQLTISDGSLTSEVIETYATVEDNGTLCP